MKKNLHHYLLTIGAAYLAIAVFVTMLAYAETPRQRRERFRRFMRGADMNGDGIITGEEWNARLQLWRIQEETDKK